MIWWRWGGGEDILVFCPLTKGRRLRVTDSKRRFSEIGSRFTEAIRFHKKYILRCLKTVSSTFQYIHFDGSLQPVLISWWYNHGIKKTAQWTRCYLGYHGNSIRLSLPMSQVAHQAGACPGFCSMKGLGIFLLPPGCDASHRKIKPPALNSPVSCPWTQRNVPG